jgi:archaellum component FlaC
MTHGSKSSMTESVALLIIEHPRHILGRVDQIAEDMSDIKRRMTSIETAMALVKRGVAAGDDTDARQQTSIDRLMQRIERIEKRLDLS